jgi:hypothetical protein
MYEYVTAPTQFVEANGIRFAYRRFARKVARRSSLCSAFVAEWITGIRWSLTALPRLGR